MKAAMRAQNDIMVCILSPPDLRQAAGKPSHTRAPLAKGASRQQRLRRELCRARSRHGPHLLVRGTCQAIRWRIAMSDRPKRFYATLLFSNAAKQSAWAGGFF